MVVDEHVQCRQKGVQICLHIGQRASFAMVATSTDIGLFI